MKNLLLIFLFELLFLFPSKGQSNENCNLSNIIPPTSNNSIDTFSINVIYTATNMDFLKYTKDDYYKNLRIKYNIYDLLDFKLETNCENGYYLPIVDKKKYDTKLYHKKNENGKYEDWVQYSPKLKLKCIRFNKHSYLPGNYSRTGPIIIIIDIEEIK